MSSDVESSPHTTASTGDEEPRLYFFPDEPITASELRRILREGDADRQAWALSHLLRYAQWEEIWKFTSREVVRERFDSIELPENLRVAYARMLKIERQVPVPT